MVVRARELQTQTVTISGTTPVTISNPHTDKRPIFWLVWAISAGVANTHRVRTGGIVKMLPGSIGSTLVGNVGPLMGAQGDDIVIDSTDAAAAAEYTITYGWV